MYKILKNALMFASAGALLIMSSCNNANSEKAESGKDAKIVASTDSTITAEVDTVVSATQDTVAKVENDIYDWEEYEKGVMLQLSKTFDNFKDRLRKRDVDYLKKHVLYPLVIDHYFVIKNEADFARYFDMLFDMGVTSTVLKSNVKWYDFYRDVAYIYDGNDNQVLALNYKGSICTIYLRSNAVKSEIRENLGKDKQSLHPSCRKFDYNVIELNTDSAYVRVDSYKDKPVLSVWHNNKRPDKRPDIRIESGYKFIEGSCGNMSWVFPHDSIEISGGDSIITKSNAFYVDFAFCEYESGCRAGYGYLTGNELYTDKDGYTRILEMGKMKWYSYAIKYYPPYRDE